MAGDQRLRLEGVVVFRCHTGPALACASSHQPCMRVEADLRRLPPVLGQRE